VQWTFSHLACALFPEALGTDRVKGMGWKDWALVSIPCGLVTALDVGLSNLSLAVITITFYTMVKSSAPVFVLGWAHLFGIERITIKLVGVAAVIAVGEFFTVFGEVDFVLKGFLLCLSASFLSGARWTMVQLKLQSMDPPLKTTIVTMRLLSPSMFLSMLLISFVVERPWNVFFHENAHELLRVGLLGLVGGTIAVAMILCEFYLILEASALILMIGGVIKEMVTILIGYVNFCVEYFQDVPIENNLHQTNNLVFCCAA
jgi:solute carrier family 35 protein C2